MKLEALLKARPSRRKDLRTWYSELLDEAAHEGTSVAALAGQIGCSRETLYAWKRRLAKAGEATAPRAGLVRVRVTPPPTARDTERLEVRVQEDRSVLVPNGFNASTLAAVVAVLEQC